MAALMDAGFPNRGDFVQAGVDDVATHTRPADPNAPETALVVFPEDVGLVTALIGSRGAASREQTTAAGAIGSLLATYQPQFAYYAAKFPAEAASLSLSYGAVRDMEVIDAQAVQLAIVISKDAWMVDVNDRFAAKGANVILQPEAFSEWAYAPAPWQPDIFKEGGYANLQKIGSFLLNVDASMTGNFLDVTFDGQSAIIGRKRKIDPGPLGPANAWIGQNPDTGFRAMAPWIEPDPGIATAALGLAARRMLLATDGATLLPGSGIPCPDSLTAGACENGYREAIVWADVDLPDGPVTAAVDSVRASPPH